VDRMPQRTDEALRDHRTKCENWNTQRLGPQAIEDAPDDFGLKK